MTDEKIDPRHPTRVVRIYDGKYEFYEDERGILMCKRHGEPWREFVGDKAVHGLFSRTHDLENGESWDDRRDEWSDAIDAAYPTRSGSHDEYATAMKMVGNRHSKGALVALVNWLLVREKDAALERRERR